MPIQPKQQPPFYQPTNYSNAKQYIVMGQQAGTNPPTYTEYLNTIGLITSTRYGIGSYALTTNGLFTIDKTIIPGFSTEDLGGNDVIIPLYANAGKIRITIPNDGNEIYILTKDNTDSNVEWNTILGKFFLPIIYVYQ